MRLGGKTPIIGASVGSCPGATAYSSHAQGQSHQDQIARTLATQDLRISPDMKTIATTQEAADALLLAVRPRQGCWSDKDYLWFTDRCNCLVELVDGCVEKLPRPTDTHQTVLAFLFRLLDRHVEARGGVVRFAAGPTLPAPALPRPDLTPGAVRRVSVEEVCGRSRSLSRPPVAAAVARRVFEDYGADYRRAAEYELDFLITPELGGTADARNLWPQPYGSTRWNAYVKDELEQLFQRLVCDGAIDISTAQREMATDWIAAYRRYFATDRPRRGPAPPGDQNG